MLVDSKVTDQEDRRGDRSTKEESPLLNLGKYVAFGLEFPSTVIGGIVVGYLLDLYFDTSPWLAISMTSVAFLGACVRLVQWGKHFEDNGK
jgi:F0F1-type ATP synthase assembly protein I